MKKNKAASDLAKMRWSRLSKKERAQQVPQGSKRGRPPRKYSKRCTKYPHHVFSPKTGKCYGCGFVKPS